MLLLRHLQLRYYVMARRYDTLLACAMPLLILRLRYYATLMLSLPRDALTPPRPRRYSSIDAAACCRDSARVKEVYVMMVARCHYERAITRRCFMSDALAPTLLIYPAIDLHSAT